MRISLVPRSRAMAATRAYAPSCSRSARSAAGWPRISERNVIPPACGSGAASGNDTSLTADADAVDLEVVVEHDEVGGQVDVEPADGRGAQHAGRYGSGSLDGVAERDSELMEVPNRVDHRQRAPGKHVVEAARNAVAYLDLRAAEQVRPVAHPRAGDGVRDERDASGRRAPHDLRGLGRKVDAVEDDLDDDVVACQRCTGETWVAVPERPHGVEEVRDAAHATVEGRRRFLGGGVRVPARDGHAAQQQEID